MPYIVPPVPTGVDADAWSAAVAKVRSHCRWHIAPSVTETVTVDGSGAPIIVLPTLRLTDLISITNDGTAVTSPEWSTSGMVYRGTCASWSPKFRSVVAEMTHGFDTWPEDLEAVTVELAAATSLAGVKQISSGSHQVSFETSMNAHVLETLERYKLPFLQ